LVHKCLMKFNVPEVCRLLMLTKSSILPITFTLTKEKGFNPALFPETRSYEPALTAIQWFNGSYAEPNLMHVGPTDVPRTNNDDDEEEIQEEWYVPKELKIIRSTHYRHIFGVENMESQTYTNLRISNNASLSHTIRGNSSFYAVPWEGTGGRLAIFPLSKPGRVGVDVPTVETRFTIHDFDFNPFHPTIIAIGGDDSTIKIFEIPQEGLKPSDNIIDHRSLLSGHKGKVNTVDFHRSIDNLLVTSSYDNTIRLWDINHESPLRTISGLDESVINLDWNYLGDLLVASCKDRTIRIFDARQQSAIYQGPDIGGSKGSKVSWLGQKDKIFTVGFSTRNERKYMITDFRKLDVSLTSERIDYEAGILDPFYDEDTEVMMLWGKGDTSIKFYEIVDEAPYCHFLTEYNTIVMQTGMAFLHKTSCDVREVEIAKVLKLTLNSMIPISIRVPRTKKDYFQDDIYPDTRSLEPSMSSEDYVNSSEVEPPRLLNLNPGLELLSSIPKEVRRVKKVKGNEKDRDVGVDTVNKLYENMLDLKEDEDVLLPGEDREGVGSDEWGDKSDSDD